MTDPKLLKEILKDFYNPRVVFYGFNVINDASALVQTGSGYRTMKVVDSALTSSNSSEMGAGDIIVREENLMSFIIPQNFTAVFAIVKAVTEAGTSAKYMRLMLGYGPGGNTTKEIARSAETGADYRTEMTLVGSYSGIVASAADTHKILVETHDAQEYSSINILIGVVL